MGSSAELGWPRPGAPIVGVVVMALIGQVPVLAPQPDVAAAAAWIEQRRRPADRVARWDAERGLVFD